MGAGINRLPDGSEILRKFNHRCKDANYPDYLPAMASYCDVDILLQVHKMICTPLFYVYWDSCQKPAG